MLLHVIVTELLDMTLIPHLLLKVRVTNDPKTCDHVDINSMYVFEKTTSFQIKTLYNKSQLINFICGSTK